MTWAKRPRHWGTAAGCVRETHRRIWWRPGTSPAHTLSTTNSPWNVSGGLRPGRPGEQPLDMERPTTENVPTVRSAAPRVARQTWSMALSSYYILSPSLFSRSLFASSSKELSRSATSTIGTVAWTRIGGSRGSRHVMFPRLASTSRAGNRVALRTRATRPAVRPDSRPLEVAAGVVNK